MFRRNQMKRRKFLQSAARGGALAVSKPVSLLAANDAGPPQYSPKEFELEELTISDLQDRLRSGKFTAHSLVRKYLERIADVDRRGPRINSIIEINPEAEAMAAAMDQERKQ